MESSVLFRFLLFSVIHLWALPIFSQEKKLVFIILDGIPASELERAETPNLDQIAGIGGYARAFTGGIKEGYSQTPTISAVGYNSLLTGTWANKHNVWGNGIEAPNYHYWTIFRFLKEARPDAKTAIFSTWQDNRTKLLGESLAETNFLKLDKSFDGLELDTLTYPHDEDHLYIRDIDQKVAENAADYLRDAGPDLSWVYLQFTDDMGHRHGKSAQLDEAIRLADAQVGKVWEAVQYRQMEYGEDWMIWITTDHGRKEPEGKDHGGQSDSEREIWMVTNAKNLNERFYSGKAAMVDILPSFLRFFNLVVKEEREAELDGVSLIGNISIENADLSGKKKNQKVVWRPVDDSEKVSIYWSPTHHFSKGGFDEYMLLGEVGAATGSYDLPLWISKKKFFKILIVGERNSLNVWKLSKK
ncbi:type I phosphodiesterase/nucleotide pyrophosphatase [Algoriphagus aquaeductus]|uniref:Type I phosphodiesterase/nucleotide pyrophosphatase n=1 Tax=Algoriphagus aquaeductus TaxID=475299 RepID=A0A326RY01_9BACT|nr:alkaline phosphatase family protein [Algoriphagus aquaeductus]PZV86271.1 type I phosphodiesterase/nucleotide pyrophosphatase [Algoriphagus aquaeductus]